MDATDLPKIRRRKRRFNWSRQKKGKYTSTRRSYSSSRVSSRCSYFSKRTSRPNSVLSLRSFESYESFYPPSLHLRYPVVVSLEMSLPGYLSLSRKRTRSFARLLDEEELVVCPECHWMCNVDGLAAHNEEVHKKLRLFFCKFCNKRYTSKNELNVHMKIHPPQYPCAICQKKFYESEDLLCHWQIHVRKAIPCIYCRKKFHNFDVLKKHVRSAHVRKLTERVDFNDKVEIQKKEDPGDFQVRVLIQDAEKEAARMAELDAAWAASTTKEEE